MKTRNIWVISDTHFRHAAMLGFTGSDGKPVRPGFANVDEVDELMMENWNSVVKTGDLVYHLGDVVIHKKQQDKEWFQKNWPKLNGSKRLVVGNHDDVKWLASGGFFQKVLMWRMFPEFGLMLSHVPLHESSLLRHVDRTKVYPDGCITMLNVHGHIHSNPSPEGPYRNVCVEVTNYTPVNIEELRIL